MTSVLKDLVMIPVHTKPEDSEKELDELYDVTLHVINMWATDVRWRLYQQKKNEFISERNVGHLWRRLFLSVCFVVAYSRSLGLNDRLIGVFP